MWPIDGFRRALFDALVDNSDDGYVRWDSDLQRWQLYRLDGGFNDRLDGAISEALQITNELLTAKALTLAAAPATNAPPRSNKVHRVDNNVSVGTGTNTADMESPEASERVQQKIPCFDLFRLISS